MRKDKEKEKKKEKKIAFYVDYERFNSKEAPPILFFISYLRNIGYKVDFFINERDLIKALSESTACNKSIEFKEIKIVNNECFYDFCLLSLMSSDNLRSILQTAIKIKNISPLTVNILGGTGIYGYTRDLIKAEGIDIVIEGDAENTLPPVLDAIETAKENNCKYQGEYQYKDKDNCKYQYKDRDKDKDYKYDNNGLKIFNSFPPDLKSNIKKDEAYFCTNAHMELLFKNKGSYLSPIENISEDIYFERKWTSHRNESNKQNEALTIKCPLSDVAIKLNNGKICYFERINQDHPLFEKYYSPYKDYISREEFANIILPYPTEEEINSQYIDYPWDIYDNYGFESIGIYAQRGCNWGKCSYCSIVNYKYRKLDVDFLIKILNKAKSHNVYGISFDDDLFIQNKAWINEFLDRVILDKLNARFNFTAMVKVEHIYDLKLLDKLKKANFSKIQIGIESFLPDKLNYFSKTKQGKELIYIDKAKKIIDYCARIQIIPSSFIILTTPHEKFSLFDIVNEIGEIIDLMVNVYEKHKILPIFVFNDFITAYPNAPLLNKQAYSNFMVALSGYISSENLEGNKINLLNLNSLRVPYMYQFKNFQVIHFIDGLFKNYSNGESNLNEKTDEERMFFHIKNILNSLYSSFNMYGSPLFLLYDIVDKIDLDMNLEKIFKEYFNIHENYANNFKKLLASGKIDQEKTLIVFKEMFNGIDDIGHWQNKDKERGKDIINILTERLDIFQKNYNSCNPSQI